MTHETSNPDLFLARRAQRSDPRAWEELVELYGGRIYNVCLQFADNPAEAEDLTQEVFLKLHGQLGKYRGDVPLVAWALRLSRNLCIDHYRHHRRRKESETVSDEVLRQMPTATQDPSSQALERENRRMVRAALAEMSEDLATVIVLRDLQGWSYDEVAGALEVNLGTVKSRLFRARRELVSRVEQRLGLEPAAALSQEARPC